MADDLTLPFIKREAQVPVTLSSGTIQDMQSVLLHVLQGHTQEEVSAIQEKISSKTQLSGWEFSAVTITRLLKLITDSAISTNQVEYKPLDDTVHDLIQ